MQQYLSAQTVFSKSALNEEWKQFWQCVSKFGNEAELTELG